MSSTNLKISVDVIVGVGVGVDEVHDNAAAEADDLSIGVDQADVKVVAKTSLKYFFTVNLYIGQQVFFVEVFLCLDANELKLVVKESAHKASACERGNV